MSPSSRDTVDPIAELLSQLSGVRRSTGNTSSSTPTQLQQLQMQLQLERQQVNTTRQQLERLPRRQTQSQTARESTVNAGANAPQSTLILNPSPAVTQPSSNSVAPMPPPSHSFLLTSLLEEPVQNNLDEDRAEFVRQLLFSTLLDDDETNELREKTVPSLPLSLNELKTMLDSILSGNFSDDQILQPPISSSKTVNIAPKLTATIEENSSDNDDDDSSDELPNASARAPHLSSKTEPK